MGLLEPTASIRASAGVTCTPAALTALNARPIRLFEVPAAPEALPYGVALMRVPTPMQARALLAPADADERRRRSAVFYQPTAYRVRARLPLGQHDRMEEYLLAEGRVHERDKAGHERHFPIHFKSVRLHELRLGEGEMADVSAAHAVDWPGLHLRDELYLRVSIDRLLVAPGAVLRWSGNVACVQIGQLIAATPVTRDAPFTIQIRGTPHRPHSRAQRVVATASEPGAPGRDGRDGTVHGLWQTPFGPRPLGPPAVADGEGEAGTPGGPGSAGFQGRNGGMAMLAGIEIFAMDGVSHGGTRLDVEAEPGESGSAGGDGGPGGAGGSGAPGWVHPSGTKTAGQGGSGGAGGNGGAGGKGGAGGLASHVFITVPRDARAALEVHARPATGGPGGEPGRGGAGGRGGRGGRGVDHPFLGRDADGEAGHDGACGEAGSTGPAGRNADAATVWVHDASTP